MRKRINQFIKIHWLQHLLFWVLSFYFIGSYFSISNQIKAIDFIYSGFFHISLIILVYINIKAIIPHLLQKERYTLFVIASALNIVLAIAVHEVTFDILIPLLPLDYYMVSFTDISMLMTIYSIYTVLSTLLKLSKSWFYIQEVEREKIEMELSNLKFQVNPHFLLNSLNSIYGLALKKDDNAPDVVMKLGNMLKHMLYDAKAGKVPLEREIDYLNNYVELQKIRTSKDASIRFDIFGDTRKLEIAPLLLISFFENSFKHGISSASENRFAHFKITVEGDELRFIAKNNLSQYSDITKIEQGGIGLSNVKRRLELLYKKNYTLEINSTIATYEVHLNLKLV